MTSATRTIRKINDFRFMPVGWHYGKGGPISEKTIGLALHAYESLLLVGLSRTDAFPGADGEVLVTAYHKKTTGFNSYIAVMIETNGFMSVRYEINQTDVSYIESDDIRVIKTAIYDIARTIWNILGSSIQKTLISTSDGLATWHLSVPQTEECQLSIEFVPRELVAA
jgi:hypothetical protein